MGPPELSRVEANVIDRVGRQHLGIERRRLEHTQAWRRRPRARHRRSRCVEARDDRARRLRGGPRRQPRRMGAGGLAAQPFPRLEPSVIAQRQYEVPGARFEDARKRTEGARTANLRASHQGHERVRKRARKAEALGRLRPAATSRELVRAAVDAIEIGFDAERVGDCRNAVDAFGGPILPCSLEDPSTRRIGNDERAVVAERAMSVRHRAALGEALGELDELLEGVVGRSAGRERNALEVHPGVPGFGNGQAREHRFVSDRDAVLVDAHFTAPHPRRPAQQEPRIARWVRQAVRRGARSGTVVTFEKLGLRRFPIAVLGKPNRPDFGHDDHRVTHASAYHGGMRKRGLSPF